MGTFTIHPSRPNLSDFLYPIVGQNNNTLRILAKWAKSICPRHFWFASLHMFDTIILLVQSLSIHPPHSPYSLPPHHIHNSPYPNAVCSCVSVLLCFVTFLFFFLFLFVTPLFPTDTHALSRHKKWREKRNKSKFEELEENCLHESRFEGGGCIMQNEPLRYESYLSGTQTKKSSSPEHIHTPCSVRTVLCCVPTLHYLLRSLHFTNTTKQTFPALSRSFSALLYYVFCSFIHAEKRQQNYYYHRIWEEIEEEMKVTSVNNWM